MGEGNSRIWLIVLIVVLLLCCLTLACLGVGWYLYENGDEIFGLTRLLPALETVL